MNLSRGAFRRRLLVVLLPIILAAIIIAIIFVVAARNAVEDIQSDNKTILKNSGGATGLTGNTIDNARKYRVGKTISFATQDIKVNKYEFVDSIESVAGSKKAGDGAKFIVINLTVKNQTKEPIQYEDFFLWTIDGTKYTYYPDTIGYLPDYMTVREIQPRLSETGNVVYRVPENIDEFFFGGNKLNDDSVHVVHLGIDS